MTVLTASPLTQELRILRKIGEVDDDTFKYLFEHEGREPYFEQGYVDNDAPRDVEITDDLMALTEGFVLADPDGNPIDGTFVKTLAEAEALRANARVEFRIVADMGDTAEASDGLSE